MKKINNPDQLDIILHCIQALAHLEELVGFGEVTPNETRRSINVIRRSLSKLV